MYTKQHNTITIQPLYKLDSGNSQMTYLNLYPKGILILTVNSDIFARGLFSRNFADAKIRENKTLAKWRNGKMVNHAIVANFKRGKYVV